MSVVVYNPGPIPVVIDPEGHEVGGFDWRAVDPEFEPVKAAIKSGALTVRKHPPLEHDDERAIAAFTEAQTAATAPQSDTDVEER